MSVRRTRETRRETQDCGALCDQHPNQPFSTEQPSRLRSRDPQRDDPVSIEFRDVDLVAVDNHRTDVTTTYLEGYGLKDVDDHRGQQIHERLCAWAH